MRSNYREGNHFAELQKVEEVLDATAFKQLGLGNSNWLSWSTVARADWANPSCGTTRRKWGGRLRPAKVLPEPHISVTMTWLLRWAEANRRSSRDASPKHSEPKQNSYGRLPHSITPSNRRSRRKEALTDVPEAYAADPTEEVSSSLAATYVHRKGAVTAEDDFVVIPGSAGSLSYLVKPNRDGASHAGRCARRRRKWRGAKHGCECANVSRAGVDPHALGGRFICEERETLYEKLQPLTKTSRMWSRISSMPNSFSRRDVSTAPDLQNARRKAANGVVG